MATDTVVVAVAKLPNSSRTRTKASFGWVSPAIRSTSGTLLNPSLLGAAATRGKLAVEPAVKPATLKLSRWMLSAWVIATSSKVATPLDIETAKVPSTGPYRAFVMEIVLEDVGPLVTRFPRWSITSITIGERVTPATPLVGPDTTRSPVAKP